MLVSRGSEAVHGTGMTMLQGVVVSTDVASVVLIGNEFWKEINRIQNDPTLSASEKEKLVKEQLQMAAGIGLLLIIG
jgi:UPF0716 family protein affecting phage T7 exclusion